MSSRPFISGIIQSVKSRRIGFCCASSHASRAVGRFDDFVAALAKQDTQRHALHPIIVRDKHLYTAQYRSFPDSQGPDCNQNQLREMELPPVPSVTGTEAFVARSRRLPATNQHDN